MEHNTIFVNCKQTRNTFPFCKFQQNKQSTKAFHWIVRRISHFQQTIHFRNSEALLSQLNKLQCSIVWTRRGKCGKSFHQKSSRNHKAHKLLFSLSLFLTLLRDFKDLCQLGNRRTLKECTNKDHNLFSTDSYCHTHNTHNTSTPHLASKAGRSLLRRMRLIENTFL